MTPPMGQSGHLCGALQIATLLLAPLTAGAETPTAAEQVPSPILELHYEPIQPLPQPAGLNPGKVSLGERLFHETRLSQDNKISCASCHLLDDNGADHLPRSRGRNGVELDVNTLTVFNSSLNPHQFWDGRANSLEEQIDFVVNSPKEFATSWPVIIDKLKQDKSYREAFRDLYPDGITASNIRNALATFERTLITANSRFDQFLLGRADAITATEKKGYQLFKSYGCVACHQGSNVGGNLFIKFGVFGDYFASRGNPTPADLGRFNVTHRAADRHVFRVPSLRLITLTAPYFHDGSVETLEEAIKLVAKHLLGRVIPDQDIRYLIAFLKTLPGEYKGRPLPHSNPAPDEPEKP